MHFSAQKRLYRTIAGMERSARIDAGAYVYVSRIRAGEAITEWNGGSVLSAGEERYSGYTLFY